MSLNKKSTYSDVIINSQNIYELGLAIYLVVSLIQFSTFMDYFSDNSMHYLLYIGLGLILFKMFFLDKQDLKEFAVKILTLGFLVLIWRTSSDFMLLTMGVYILGAKDVQFRRIIKLYFIVGTMTLLFIMLCSLTGVIKNLIYHRIFNSVTRQSFGIIYPTDFAAHVLYLLLAYSYLKFEQLSWGSYACYLVIAWLLITFCDARLSAITIVIAIPVLWLGQKALRGNKVARGLTYFYWWIPAILAYLTICSYYFYTQSNSLFEKMNYFLSGRLFLGKLAIDKYGFSWFGTHVIEHGWGGSKGFKMTTSNPDNYFYIDSSFLRVAILYGIIALIIIVTIMTIITWRSVHVYRYALASIITLVAISAIVEQRLVDLSFNPFLLALLANIYPKDVRLGRIRNEKLHN